MGDKNDPIPLATVKLLLEQQREDFSSVLRGFMKSVDDRYDALKTTLIEIKTSLEYSQKEVEALNSSYSMLNQSSTAFDTALKTAEARIVELTDKTDYLENQSRRNNILFDGIEESPDETWSDTESKVQNLLKSKFGFKTKPLIERAHRVGRPSQARPRPIVVKFNTFKDREAVLTNRRRSQPVRDAAT